MLERPVDPRSHDACKPASNRLSRLLSQLFASVDITSLVFFRAAFGALMLWEISRFFAKGWIEHYIDRPFHFTYYGFGWVRPWPGDWLYAHFFVLGVLATCIMLGLCYRISLALFTIGFTYVFLLEQAYYLNHFYLICLLSLLMIFVPAHRAFSLDVTLRPRIGAHSAPAWALWLLRAQIGIVYFYGGLAKLNLDWLHGQPLGIWLAGKTDFPLVGHLFTMQWMVLLCSYGSLLLDLFAVPLLLWRPSRLPAFAALVVFHLLNAGLWNIGVFPWLMIAATLLFFPPDWPRRLALGRQFGSYEPSEVVGPVPLKAGHWATILTLGAYLAVQLLVPLRHYLYPGNVNWTTEGHRFAWHMMLWDKEGTAVFEVTDPIRGESRRVDPRSHLTVQQFAKMVMHPDMVLQCSKYIADQYRRRGYKQIEVRAAVSASLNGRKPQLLVDPQANLASMSRTLWPVDWVLPLVEPLPDSTAEALYNFGTVLDAQGHFDKAIDRYSAALRINPDLAEAHNNLGTALAEVGRIEKATMHFRHALEIRPEYATAHNNLGVALDRQGKLEEATHHYSEALRSNPNNAQAHSNLANALFRQGMIDQAITHYYEAIRINPRHGQAHYNLGVALADQGRLQEAAEQFSEVVRLDAGDADARYHLARALSGQGRIDEAIAHYREVLLLRPTWAAVATELAWILATHEDPKFRDADEALKLAEQACQATNNQQPEALDTLAAAYAEAERFDDAVAAARQAITLASAAKQAPLVEQIRRRLHLYQARRPFRTGQVLPSLRQEEEGEP